jgi:large subunit ribosomal protein L4
MKSFKIIEINFEEEKVTSKDFKTEQEICISSAKTVAYVIRWQLARNRAGTASTKLMSEISGTTAKPWKQKGTGRARQGSRRSVQFVGGRACHGPTPRSFDFSIPKKIAQIATIDAIKNKLLENKIYTYSNITKNIKTSVIGKLFNENNIKSALIIHDGDKNIELSARNIKNVKILNSKAINTLDLINYEHLIIDSKSFSTKIAGVLK